MARFVGTGWTTLVGGDPADAAGYAPSATGVNSLRLAAAADGTPYVAFSDPATADVARVRKYAAGQWSTVGVEDVTAAPAGSLALAIGADGKVFLAVSEDPKRRFTP